MPETNCDLFNFLDCYRASKFFKFASRLPTLNREYYKILGDYLREFNLVNA